MEELSSNNVNTVENTEVPVAGVDPEVLPPVEIQNQIFLFDDLHELQDVEPTGMFHASLPLSLLEPQEIVELDMSSVLPGPALKYMIRENMLREVEISQQEKAINQQLSRAKQSTAKISHAAVITDVPTANELTPITRPIRAASKLPVSNKPQHE